MAAIALEPTQFPMQGLVPYFIKATTLTTGDWINLEGTRGVFLPASLAITSSTNNEAPDVATVQYGTALSTAAYATVTTTSIVIDGAGAHATLTRQVPFFVKCKNAEIMEVIADSAPEAATATWTVRRGCYGTTPAAIADNDHFEILNQLVLSSTRVGFVTGLVFTMPEDPATKPFA